MDERLAPARRSVGTTARTVLRVRMYRIGLGDCFLLSLTGNGAPAHVLIDCGVHPEGDRGLVPDIVDDIAAETDRHLDLVIASHAGSNHVSGFAQGAELFKQFSVGEVWLPWTEDAADAMAAGLRPRQCALAGALDAHLACATVPDHADGAAQAAAANAAGDPAALALLKSGLSGGTVRYLAAGARFAAAAGIRGLEASILGPPRERGFVAGQAVARGDRVARLDAGGGATAPVVVPFSDKWTASTRPPPERIALSTAEKAALDGSADQAAALAFALDRALGNGGLVTLFCCGGRKLLFPGDAQPDGWQAALPPTVTLDQIDLLKVPHHGSRNALAGDLMARMRTGFVAMLSTQSSPWPAMPCPSVVRALEQKAGAVIRSDADAVPSGLNALDRGCRLRPGPFWWDCVMAL